MIKILQQKNKIYDNIITEFISLCQKTTGYTPEITSDTKTADNLIIIGDGYEEAFPFI